MVVSFVCGVCVFSCVETGGDWSFLLFRFVFLLLVDRDTPEIENVNLPSLAYLL